MLRVGLVLAAFAIGATSLVVLTENETHDKIIENERQTLLNAINAVIAKDQYNNEILADTVVLEANNQLGTNENSIVYRARLNDEPVAVVLSAIAPNGYNGKIKLLVGIAFDGRLTGVRVISHKETPGLGDKIDTKKADWILNFKGLSLSNPNVSKWKVKKDGGEFDQFTGATITPRAVVTAVKNSLLYFDAHRDELFVISETEK
ncbi:electron transport complex subunit G [Methylophaga sp. 42_25_T18]|nr:electron transport complex subunit G [Methylophaga sp. 42_25_T18]OUR87672.1 electron transport complex subunit G [Methylophaga sp. 42_8_T64]